MHPTFAQPRKVNVTVRQTFANVHPFNQNTLHGVIVAVYAEHVRLNALRLL